MLTLINGDGNPRVTAAQDADWYGSLTGEKTCIMPANDKFSATVADANTIEISSGVLITKEGRRVQIDAETIEEIIIPTGTQGTDTYYIIGFHLYIDESGQQVAETFVETMENESDTITETTFREGSTSIYISLYRVKRSGLTLESVTRICPMYEISADEIVYGNTDVGSELTQINSDLTNKEDKHGSVSVTADGVKTYHTLFNELYALIDRTKLTDISVLKTGQYVFQLERIQSNEIWFSFCQCGSDSIFIRTAMLGGTSSHLHSWNGSTHTTMDGTVPTNGEVIKLSY